MKKISKQKFYEESIRISYQHPELNTSLEDEINAFLKTGKKIEDMSFVEFLINRTLLGFTSEIPVKQPFDKLGKEYIMQLAGFASRIGDDDYTMDFFGFLESNPEFIYENDEEVGDFFYTLYYRSICGEYSDHYFARFLGDILVRHFNRCDFYGKLMTLVRSFGIVREVDIVEILDITKKLGDAEHF